MAFAMLSVLEKFNELSCCRPNGLERERPGGLARERPDGLARERPGGLACDRNGGLTADSSIGLSDEKRDRPMLEKSGGLPLRARYGGLTDDRPWTGLTGEKRDGLSSEKRRGLVPDRLDGLVREKSDEEVCERNGGLTVGKLDGRMVEALEELVTELLGDLLAIWNMTVLLCYLQIPRFSCGISTMSCATHLDVRFVLPLIECYGRIVGNVVHLPARRNDSLCVRFSDKFARWRFPVSAGLSGCRSRRDSS